MPEAITLNESMGALTPKNKEPNSKRVLDSWIAHAEATIPAQGDRLAWIIATTVIAAMLQKVVDENGDSRFYLKGGVLLQHKLGLSSRATKDLDSIVRGDIGDFLAEMDKVLKQPWGSLTFRRSEIETIEVPSKTIKPRAFEVMIMLQGQTWRRVKVEVSPDEGNATLIQERFPAPALSGFGLPTPEYLVGLAMSFQIAQKIHAACTPHNPPDYINNRPRDLVDLLLLKELSESTGKPSPDEISNAVKDVFTARAKEAESLGRQALTWPAHIIAHPHWLADYLYAIDAVGIKLSIGDAARTVNTWLDSLK